jgi:hypothetical protein
MTKLFKRGVEAVEALPEDQQDLAGALLLKFANVAEPEYRLTPEQVEDVKLALAEMERGEFATEEEIEEAWRSFER